MQNKWLNLQGSGDSSKIGGDGGSNGAPGMNGDAAVATHEETCCC